MLRTLARLWREIWGRLRGATPRGVDPLPRAHGLHETAWEERIARALRAAGHDCATEHRLDDATRVDLLLAYHAAEIDWAPKWAESIGQALYYALRTGRKPAALLLIEKDTDQVYFDRLRAVARANTPPLAVWSLDTRTGLLDFDGLSLRV